MKHGYGLQAASQRCSRRQAMALAGGIGLATTALACNRTGRARQTATRPAGGGPQHGGTLHWPQTGQIPTLDFTLNAASSGSAAGAVWACMTTLYRYKISPDPKVTANHELEPFVATSAESPDAQTWTLKLRPDVKFHNVPPVNGHLLEAEDVKASYVRALTPPSTLRGSLGMVDPAKIETPASDTIVFHLKYPYAPFVDMLGSGVYSSIFPREALSGGYDPAKTVIGSGPFIWESYNPDVEVVLKRNPEYFEAGRPYVDDVRLAFVLDPAQLAQLTAGNLDYLQVLPNDLAAAKGGAPKARVIEATRGSNKLLNLNLGDPASPFQDVRLRRALSMAIDRNAIGKVMEQNQYQLAFYLQTYNGNWGITLDQLDPQVRRYYSFDLAAAKQLFEQAGGPALEVKVAYYTGGGGADQNYVKTAQMISSMLQALPWKQVSLITIDFSKDWIGGGKGWHFTHIPNDVIMVNLLTSYSDADEYLAGYYYSTSTLNTERVKDAKLDGMIDHARTIVDEEQRRQAYLDVQKYLAEQMYSVSGTPAGNNYTFVQPRVEDFNFIFPDGSTGEVWSRLWLKQ